MKIIGTLQVADVELESISENDIEHLKGYIKAEANSKEEYESYMSFLYAKKIADNNGKRQPRRVLGERRRTWERK